ncbi:MAG: electron transport complex subunit RsxC [Magnetococcales bacterium]|nr:electron transport complex subunit RsxC [Magnetococcales bacterium]MBF0152011.1 electron transport complex subunit RsxC [Magnetococcales bacterium]
MGIVASVLKKFHGGIHPAGHKELTERCAIESMPMPKRLVIPLHQHLGAPSEPVVKVGDKVFKGDLLGKEGGFVSAAVHAPTSGTVSEILEHPIAHPSGLTMPCVIIEPDGLDAWNPQLKGVDDPRSLEPAAIRDRIKGAGIVGLGGATFPSFIKMSPPRDKVVDLLLINAVECEPYLTCDARLMEERSREVVEGIRIMLHALQTKQCIIGIEANKPTAIEIMQKAVAGATDIQVMTLPVMYPQGAEKQLIEVVTGRQVPSKGLPVDVGVIVHNVATAVAIRNAIQLGQPLLKRIVTVTGHGIVRPANLEVLIGTLVDDVLAHCGGLKPDTVKVVMGGPMMGLALYQTNVPVVKGTSGILALLRNETPQTKEHSCIRCGSCVRACPMQLVPCSMAWFAKTDQIDQLPGHDLFDCIECGSCAYVCPANIPLVHYFRFGKLSWQAKERENKKRELTKQRTQSREERLGREKEERERKKEEMKAKMAAKKSAGGAAADEKNEAKPAVNKNESKTTAASETKNGGDDKAARAAKAALAAKAAKAAKEAKSVQGSES